MAERVVRNIENDYLMCSICLSRYRDPRLLPCGHTFCRQCLDDHIKQTVNDRTATFLTCPNDRSHVSRPVVGLSPQEWASAFPVDSFISSLINAVMLHGVQGENETDKLMCKEHKGRLLEFYCLGCRKVACPYCVVKNHKGDKCECIAVDEAVDACRPQLDAIRRRFQKQIQRARGVSTSEAGISEGERKSKEKCLADLERLEVKLSQFYQTFMKQITSLKQSISEVGSKHKVSERDQAVIMLEKINETVNKFDDLCTHGSGIEILEALSRLEGQANEFDVVLKSLGNTTNPIQLQLQINRPMERLLDSTQSLASLKITNAHTTNLNPAIRPPASATPLLSTPRNPVSHRSMSETGLLTDRSQRGRDKITFSVKFPRDSTTVWQLTGIVLFDNYVVIADAHNNRLRRHNFMDSSTLPSQLTLDVPVCVAAVYNSTDVVVTLPEKKQIVLVHTDNNLRIQEYVETQKSYEGIIAVDARLFAVSCCVVGKQSVDIISLTGRIVKSFSSNDTGQALFSWPRFLAVTPGGNILVTDRDEHALICMTQEGVVEWIYRAPGAPWDVACHEDGRVFLCLDNNTLQILSCEGRIIEDKFITARDGVNIPYTVSTHGRQLALTEWGSSLFSPNSPLVHIFSI
ncbi:hypothetical protein CHS0354_035063 [Potamilus streckersoni]|uniref:Uncharacterized protein n=1 Tax=Potamilus streckersoni TaxID=2493646 RepID=A0AAE0S7A1_9BIVA|nr:hypothetical protein CHS0354_035063 [Potamilus streckersoni]